MKNFKGLLTFIMIGSSLPYCIAQSQWNLVASGTNENISDIYFANDQLGFGVALHSILRTTDGGDNWAVIHSDSSLSSQLSIVTTTDSVHCFGQELFGDIVKISFPYSLSSFTKSYIDFLPIKPTFFNNDIIFLDYAGPASLYYWNNGNRTLIFPGTEDFNIYGNYITVTSSTIMSISSDFGQTWANHQFTSEFLSSGPYQSFYNGGDTIIATTHYSARVHVSYDHGLTWEPHETAACYFYFYSPLNYIGIPLSQSSFNIFTTMDAGNTFTIDTLQHPVKYLYQHTNGISFVYGDNGIIYKNTSPFIATSISNTENKLSKTRLYPNPTGDVLVLDLPCSVNTTSIALINIGGQRIREFDSSERVLDLRTIDSGVYLLQVVTNEGSIFKKVIKQ